MQHLVVGLGEVGSALKKVLEGRYQVFGLDVDGTHDGKVDVMHVCIPYSGKFTRIVKDYRKRYLASGGLLIVHSTVPVGTCTELEAVHSPVRGVHPDLEAGIRTFVKAFGGPRAEEAAVLFRACGIKTDTTEKAETTEAAKLWCTTAYFWSIALQKEMKEYCDKNALDFDFVYSRWTRDYNAGYNELGMGHVARPIIAHKPGGIGGHCLLPNAKLLGHWIGRLLGKRNKHYELTGR